MESGYRPDRPGTFYLMSNPGFACLKVGITNDLDSRFRVLRRLGYRWNVAATTRDGRVALAAESIMLGRLRGEGIAFGAPLGSDGYTETFPDDDQHPYQVWWRDSLAGALELAGHRT